MKKLLVKTNFIMTEPNDLADITLIVKIEFAVETLEGMILTLQ